jgi:hypothetical protein
MRSEGVCSRIYDVHSYRFTLLAGFSESNFTNMTGVLCVIFRIKKTKRFTRISKNCIFAQSPCCYFYTVKYLAKSLKLFKNLL